MKNENIRELLNKYKKLNEVKIEYIEIEPLDNSIIGIIDNKLVYSRVKMVNELANDFLNNGECETYQEAYETASEWIDYNVISSMREKVIIVDFEINDLFDIL